jgi:hypothetical protein
MPALPTYQPSYALVAGLATRNTALPSQNNLTLIGLGFAVLILVVIVIVACLCKRRPGKKATSG